MLAFLHHVYNRAKVLGAKFRFGRPNFLSLLKNKKISHDRQNRSGGPYPGFCLPWFFIAWETSSAMPGVFCPNPSRECAANCILTFAVMGVLAVFPPNASVMVYAGGGASQR